MIFLLGDKFFPDDDEAFIFHFQESWLIIAFVLMMLKKKNIVAPVLL